jgi:hypothetical protein
MGMNIVVGVFPEFHEDADDEELNEQRAEFAAINRVLLAAGLPEHEEPESAVGPAPRNFRVGSWACVHFLRRIAVSLAVRGSLPPPIKELPEHDPVLETYSRSCTVRQMARTGGVQVVEGPGFEHLIWHSDCHGYYIPIPFRPVLLLPEEPPWDQWGRWLGSSNTLLQECERLAEALRYPRELDSEAIRQHEPDPSADGWRRYAVESFMCQVLIEAAGASIDSGCAIVFC